MHFAFLCKDKPGSLQVRLDTRPEHLAYLNALEKLNCAYCSYANGVIAFTREVAGRTERYWCPIKHARRVLGAHPHYSEFVDYGDAEAFRRDAAALAANPAPPPAAPPDT